MVFWNQKLPVVLSKKETNDEPVGSIARARSSSAPSASDTRLHGRVPFAARVGWILLTLLALALSAIAIPRAAAVLQSICQPGSQTFGIE